MKIAVVTGTSYGLGKSIAKLLLSNGYKVYGISRTKTDISNSNFVWLKCNLLENEDIENIATQVFEESIDLLINNAGVVFAENGLGFTKEVFDKTFGVNLIAPVMLTMVLRDKLDNNLVINISSTSDRFAESGLAMYCSSKSAVEIYFDAIAIENPQIKFINILPVYIDTPMLDKISKDLNFSTNDANTPELVAGGVINVINKKIQFDSGSRVMILTNKNIVSETIDSEKLWYYNIDTKEFKKIK